MSNRLFPWQQAAWLRLQQMRGRLPHALLFHGPSGIGKTRLAEQFARSLLCEMPLSDGHACGQCASCLWFDQYSHPDYRRLRPEALELQNTPEAEGSGEDSEAQKGAKASRAPSKEIRIDQVRELADFVNISTHRQGRRLILMYPVEALNTAAANALLKTLEEPPPQTVFLLVSHAAHRLLPTILSRCRQFELTMPAAAQALQWLQEQGIEDAEAWLAEHGGAPLAAYASAQAGSRETVDGLLQQLARPAVNNLLKEAYRLQKVPAAELVTVMQRWLYDLFSVKLTGEVRYYPKYLQELRVLAAKTDIHKLLQTLKALTERRAIAEHPLSPRLFIEDLLLDYSTLFS